jgi:hypothetical protein
MNSGVERGKTVFEMFYTVFSARAKIDYALPTLPP